MSETDFQNFSGTFGNVTNPYKQAYDDTCAIKSQQLILNEFGVPVTEEQLVQYSTERGWYQGHGTRMGDVGRLLVDAGIPCTQSEGNIFDLASQLAQGHKVIVAVDSRELWYNEDTNIENPDHALIVAGLDMTDPNNPMVILTDPGMGHPAQPYSLEHFMDAWSDSGCYMVSTNIATPDALNTFAQNDMPMHLPEVAGVDFNTFQNFQTISHYIEPVQMPELYDVFRTYPEIPDPNFFTTMDSFGIPYDISWFNSTADMIDPIIFDYTGIYSADWMTPAAPSADAFAITNHSAEVLTDLHNDALDYAQQCMDNGMYASAQMWQNQAMNIQSQIDEL